MKAKSLTARIREILGMVTLCNAQAPEAPGAQPYASTRRKDGTEVWADILSPAQSGMSADQLVALFNKDQKLACPDIAHPAIEGSDESLFGGICHYAQDLTFRSSMFIPSGLAVDRVCASYCLLARKRGRIVGMASFQLSLPDCEDENLDGASSKEMRTQYPSIHLNLVYVRRRYRNKGYSIVLMSAIAAIFQKELQHLNQQLMPAALLMKKPFRLEPMVYSDWVSQSGKLAHFALMDELGMVVDNYRETAKDSGEPQAFLLKHADYDGGY